MVTTYSDIFLESAKLPNLISAYGTVFKEDFDHPNQKTQRELDRVSKTIKSLSPKKRAEGASILSERFAHAESPEKAAEYDVLRNNYRSRFQPPIGSF